MTIEEANNILRNSKRPAAKSPATNSKPNVATLKQRIAEARRQVGVVFTEAQKLDASKLAGQTRKLSEELLAVEQQVSKI